MCLLSEAEETWPNRKCVMAKHYQHCLLTKRLKHVWSHKDQISRRKGLWVTKLGICGHRMFIKTIKHVQTVPVLLSEVDSFEKFSSSDLFLSCKFSVASVHLRQSYNVKKGSLLLPLQARVLSLIINFEVTVCKPEGVVSSRWRRRRPKSAKSSAAAPRKASCDSCSLRVREFECLLDGCCDPPNLDKICSHSADFWPHSPTKYLLVMVTTCVSVRVLVSPHIGLL